MEMGTVRKLAISLGVTTALIGITAAPAAAHTITPASADFGAVRIGGGGATLQFTLTAVGTSFERSEIVLASEQAIYSFVPSGFNCGNTGPIAAGTSCNVVVQFFPRVPGVKTATLSIPGASASLTGTGVAAPSKKKCKKGKKSAAAAKKCKKK